MYADKCQLYMHIYTHIFPGYYVSVVGAAVGPTLYDAAGRSTFYESQIISDVNNHRRSFLQQIRSYVFFSYTKIP